MDPYDESNEAHFVFEPVPDEDILQAWERFRQVNPSWTYSDWLSQHYTERDGRYGDWYNPQGYYDYYTIGGKDYMYDPLPDAQKRVKQEGWPTFFRKSELDWFAPSNDHDEAYWRKRWREYSRDGDGFLSKDYYLERYVTEDQFVKEMMRPVTPYAFVTPDGVWHAPGRVGWFAMSDETAESQDTYWMEWCDFIRNAPDCYVTILDCHI